jgi:hypothetical protein
MKAMKTRHSATLCSSSHAKRVPYTIDVMAATPAAIETETVST